tara:strand:+ start:102 stop:416 length:315 start_codon:yes stop_codon:yes gene_type:complete
MIKLTVFILICILSVSTSVIKNSTKKIDDETYSTKERLLFLEKRIQVLKLEHDYLSSSEKLMEYQNLYFENLLQKKPLKELKILEMANSEIIISELNLLDKNEQ